MSNFSSLKAAIQQYIKTNGNEEITGAVLQDILLSMVSVLGDTAINDLETALQTETTNRTNADGTLHQEDVALGGRIDGLQSTVQTISTMLGEGYLYAGMATTSTNPGTPTGKVFYIATAAGTYTNFSGVVLTQGINILKYNGSSWSSEQVIAIDPLPIKASTNLVTSGGVFNNMGALDASELNATENPHTLAKYADLSAALAAIPSDYQKGGMSIKFVQNSDNNYVQYRLMANSFTTDTSQWQGIADGIIAGSQDLAISGDVAKDTNTALSALGFAPKMYLGKWYSDTTGILWDSDTYDCTELIEIKGSDKFIYTNLRARSVACFDINKQFLGVGPTYMTLLATTKYVGFVFLKSYNYDYKTLNIRFLDNPLEYKDIANGLSRYMLLNAAVNSYTGNLEYFDALDCTPKIKVGRNTSYLYMNAKYFDVTCWSADGTLLGSIKSDSLINSRIGLSLKTNTAFVSVCFLKSENIDYDKLRIYSDEEEYKKELINNEGLIPHIYLGKAYNPSTGNLENFPNDLDCTNLIKVEGGINKYGNTVKVNQDVSCIFQIACFDSGYNLIGRTVGKSLKLLDNTAFFSISFLKNKNVDYTKLLIGIDVTNNIVIPTPKRGLKYYLFGDSITYYDSRAWAYDPDYYMVAYPSYIRDVLHAEISNDGVAGDPSGSITTRLLVKDLSDAYAVTYMAGTNDLVNNVPIGTLGTLDRDTYIGNLEVGLRYVLENYPQVKFYFIAPLYAKNRNITPYCEAMQSVAEAYGIPIIRWDLIGGINSINADYFLFDGIHPNNKGHKLFADSLIPFLQNY